MEFEQDFTRYPVMTRWFSPRLLLWAAYRDVAAQIFGEFADRRTTQHLADPIPSDPTQRKAFAERYNYSTGAQSDAPFWVDFVADLGDGFEATYAIAYLLSADKLRGKGPQKDGVEGIRGLASGKELEHGRLVLFAGDEVYPWPTHEAYDWHTFWPYEMALPTPPPDPRTQSVPAASRDVFAIPGNHDWYDGLNAFDDQFCRARAGRSGRKGLRFGGFQTCQHRSSFAIKLPHNWWIWGADIQLTDVLDSGQLDYFTTVADYMGKEDRFILCTAEPSWYHLETRQGHLARDNLRELIRAPIARGAKLCGIFSGDWHHYARYNEKENLGNMNLITAGGGGAYMHGTYHLRREIKFEWNGRHLDFRLDRKLEPKPSSEDAAPKETTRNACYPSKTQSCRLALNALRFPKSNRSFCFAVGVIYALMTWTFANLTVDFWLAVPKGTGINRALAQSPEQLRKCLEPEKYKDIKRRADAPSGDARYCLLDLGEDQRDGTELFIGKGTVEQWTLQLMELYHAKREYGRLFLKGIHLLFLGIVNSVFAALFLFSLWLTFFIIAQSKQRGIRAIVSRILQATAHHTAHLLVMWALYCGLTLFDYTYIERLIEWIALVAGSTAWGVEVVTPANSAPRALTLLWAPVEFWVRAVYPIEMILVGGLIGGLIFALYLSLAYVIGKVSADWIFSSQRIADYKCFLRMSFERDKLTIYPICLDSVPDRSGWGRRDDPLPGQSLVEPTSPLKPRLIEGPIVIRPNEILGPPELQHARAPQQAQASHAA